MLHRLKDGTAQREQCATLSEMLAQSDLYPSEASARTWSASLSSRARIVEIARDHGFADQRHFARRFQRFMRFAEGDQPASASGMNRL